MQKAVSKKTTTTTTVSKKTTTPTATMKKAASTVSTKKVAAPAPKPVEAAKTSTLIHPNKCANYLKYAINSESVMKRIDEITQQITDFEAPIKADEQVNKLNKKINELNHSTDSSEAVKKERETLRTELQEYKQKAFVGIYENVEYKGLNDELTELTKSTLKTTKDASSLMASVSEFIVTDVVKAVVDVAVASGKKVDLPLLFTEDVKAVVGSELLRILPSYASFSQEEYEAQCKKARSRKKVAAPTSDDEAATETTPEVAPVDDASVDKSKTRMKFNSAIESFVQSIRASDVEKYKDLKVAKAFYDFMNDLLVEFHGSVGDFIQVIFRDFNTLKTVNKTHIEASVKFLATFNNKAVTDKVSEVFAKF